MIGAAGCTIDASVKDRPPLTLLLSVFVGTSNFLEVKLTVNPSFCTVFISGISIIIIAAISLTFFGWHSASVKK